MRMDEELYRLVSTGLLGLIVLLLVLAIARLGNLQRSRGPAPLRSEPAPSSGPGSSDPLASAGVPSEVDAGREDGSPPGTETPINEPTEPHAEEVTETPTDDPEEGPFERDGRWWYRRDGELLVYDERVEQWVDPEAANTESGQARAPEPSRPAPYESPEPAALGLHDSPEVGQPEEHPLDEAKGWDASPSTHAPIPEPVSPPQPITESMMTSPPDEQTAADVQPAEEQAPATEQGPAGAELGSHWKCPACGVINGSTATSCRMCFAARP